MCLRYPRKTFVTNSPTDKQWFPTCGSAGALKIGNHCAENVASPRGRVRFSPPKRDRARQYRRFRAANRDGKCRCLIEFWWSSKSDASTEINRNFGTYGRKKENARRGTARFRRGATMVTAWADLKPHFSVPSAVEFVMLFAKVFPNPNLICSLARSPVKNKVCRARPV